MRTRNSLADRLKGRRTVALLATAVLAFAVAGCRSSYYRKSADKEVYNIIQEKQKVTLGRTNAFTIDTPYSQRKPDDIKAPEIIEDRIREGKQTLSLPEALDFAVKSNRQYQLQKEDLYLSALDLTAERFDYVPQFFAGTTVTGVRPPDGDPSVAFANRFGFDKLFKTGGRIGLDIANDVLRFYSGGGRGDSARSVVTLAFSQPLLRGAGARVAAENLTQAERNVIYEIRDFSYYQDTFAFDIVRRYLELVELQDTVKNQYNNYLSRVSLRERAEALAVDRLAPFQADMAAQEELTARNTYIVTVERYQTTLDAFKVELGLPAGYDIRLDENVLTELEAVGLMPVPLIEEQAFKLALDRRPDLLNQIDRFEDRKRQIVVAADRLKPDLILFTDSSLVSRGQTDYGTFNLNDYQLAGGVRLDLPLNRKLERNNYRSSIINFERQLRTLSLFLDDLKNDVRDALRTLELSRQSYEIQLRAKALADRRVENSELSLQAGRVQVRDVVEAQTARVQAYNAATAALIDYHLARMRLLLDLGILKTSKERFWLDYGELPEPAAAPPPALPDRLTTPDELFKNGQPN